jgi:lambda family phage portal protein
MLSEEIAALLGDPNPPEPSPPAGSAVAPPAALSVPARAGGEMAMGGYEGADLTDKALSLWSAPLQSADADILPDKDTIDGRARSMVRDDAYVQGGVRLRQDNIVGAQYLPNSRPATGQLRRAGGKTFDETWEEEFQTEVEEVFDLVAESPDHWLDAQRSNTLTGMVRMATGIELAAGEMLATVEWDRERGGDFATTIQMIDLDRLTSDPKSRLDPNVRAGIRFNDAGAPIAYQIRTSHPRDVTYDFKPAEWKEIPIRKPWGRLQVIHILEQQRPDQSRGVSELASSLKAMRIAHRIRDLNLQRLATQSVYAATITSEIPTDQLYAALGGQTSAEAVEKCITDFSAGYLGAIAKYAGKAKNLHLDGAKIPHLYPGTKLDLLSPGKDNISGTEFEQSVLRYIAASIGVSYEQLSRDYTHTNYASARAAMAETWKFMQARKKNVADRFASIIWRLWLEEAINNNRLTTFPKAKAGLLYTNGRLNLTFDALSRVDWIGASRGQIDELKETQAAIARVEAGLSTREDELARLGKDFRKVFRQLAREAKLADTLKLVFVGGQNSVVAGVSANDAADKSPKQEKKAA